MRSLLGVAANAGYVLAVQVLAVVTLGPAEYGAFSIQYLLFALASSVGLSVVSEAWTRAEAQGLGRSPWVEYGNITGMFSLTAGVLTFAISLLVPGLAPVAFLGGVAVAASVYRSSARFYSMRVGASLGVLPGDIAGLLVTVGVWGALLAMGERSLLMMVIAWTAGALASALASRWPPVPSTARAMTWLRARGPQIRPLLRDSLFQDAGAIGTPYALAPMLGFADFGVYRAVSNVAAPVRLVLTPIRPKVASAPIRSSVSRKSVGLLLAAAAVFGVASYGVLLLIGQSDADLGALAALSEYAVPTSLFVAANLVGTYLMIVARAHLPARGLWLGRLFHTAVAVVLPIAGVLIAGLPGAIWGYTVCTLVWTLGWATLISRSLRSDG